MSAWKKPVSVNEEVEGLMLTHQRCGTSCMKRP